MRTVYALIVSLESISRTVIYRQNRSRRSSVLPSSRNHQPDISVQHDPCSTFLDSALHLFPDRYPAKAEMEPLISQPSYKAAQILCTPNIGLHAAIEVTPRVVSLVFWWVCVASSQALTGKFEEFQRQLAGDDYSEIHHPNPASDRFLSVL